MDHHTTQHTFNKFKKPALNMSGSFVKWWLCRQIKTMDLLRNKVSLRIYVEKPHLAWHVGNYSKQVKKTSDFYSSVVIFLINQGDLEEISEPKR